MATNMVTIQHIWPDGQTLNIQVNARNSYHDALDQAKGTALDAFARGLGVVEATCRIPDDIELDLEPEGD